MLVERSSSSPPAEQHGLERAENPAPVKPLRILHLIDSGGLYGAEKVLLNLAVECRALGHEICVGTIVAPQDDGDPLGEAAVAEGLDHVGFGMKDGLNIPGLLRILKFARERRFDVIHSHGYKADILLGLAAKRWRPCPLVSTVHGWTAGKTISKMSLYEWLHRRLLPRFDAVVAVSQPIMAQLEQRSCRAVMIPNGIRFPAQESSGRNPRLPGPVRLLAAGRLSHEKGFDVLIEAVRQLCARGVDAELTIAGDGLCRQALQAQAEDAGLGGRVHLIGYASDLGQMYAEADVFVLPSRTEGLPMVLLEAMSRSVPVVATAVGQVPEVLQQGQLGVLVEPGCPAALAEALFGMSVLSPDRLTERVAHSKAWIRREYSAALMAERYHDVYSRCVDGG